MKSVLAGMCVRAWARSLVVAMLFLAVVLVELAAESASAKPHSKGLLSAAFDEFVFRRLTVMRPEEIARQTGQIWALVRIQPKPYVQKPSGELREGANPGEWHFLAYPIDNSRGGIVAIVSALTGQPDLKVYDYSFIPPMGGNSIDILLSAGPFLAGGLCICQVDPAKSGIDGFSPRYSIPDRWCNSVAPAFASLQDPTGPFLPGQPAANAEALKQFAMGSNPLLAMTAYRLLLAGGQTNDWLAERPFKEADPLEQSVLLYLLFSHLREAWWPRIIDNVRDMVNAAATAEQLQPLQVAVNLAWQPNPFHQPIENHCQEILKCFQARAGALGAQSPGAEYVRIFLHQHGMDPVYASGPGVPGH